VQALAIFDETLLRLPDVDAPLQIQAMRGARNRAAKTDGR
jgi:hypothetical protein